ncbi:hypothetical protein M4578_16240 [Salipiger sp. P9]|uniref:hypothetical protein n=1 Tax=Salipiger pentaromativorans TaxID=2943193 RepID=UPI002157A4AF|nr:hypothetical protein [Salipiger pentaromativorans]MCR8549382.1 hypothetical protein [Salipiger pentaromativorans]
MLRAAGLALIALATPLAAQEVLPCEWQARANAIAEPWEQNTRTFANGAVRLAVLDTIEPAAGAFWLLILSPPYNELGDRQCRVVGYNGGGFSGMSLADLGASYDPARGLTFTLPVQLYNQATAGFGRAALSVTVNQATGAVTPRLAR